MVLKQIFHVHLAYLITRNICEAWMGEINLKVIIMLVEKQESGGGEFFSFV